MLDFRLADTGELVFQGFGEECEAEIMARAYPLLAKAPMRHLQTAQASLQRRVNGRIAAAVQAEKALPLEKVPKAAETEMGKSLQQQQLGASSTLVNRRMKDVASRVLARLPSSGPKQ